MQSGQAVRQTKRYHGVVVPMITPFTPQGELDEPAVRRVIDHLIDGGVAGIFLLGTTGEEASMPASARSRLVAISVEHIARRATIYVGISHNCLANSVQAAEEYRRLGVDVLVARLPTYYSLTGPEQQAYFETLLARISGPLMLYNISSTTHMAIPLEVVEALSENSQVIGIKDSDNDLPRLQALVEKLGHRPDFSILVGVTGLAVQTLMLGADGLVPGPGNLVPGICQSLYESATRGDGARAQVFQRQVDEATALYRNGRTLAQSLGLLKAAMSALSLCGAHVLPPLPTPSAHDKEAVCRAFLEWQAKEI